MFKCVDRIYMKVTLMMTMCLMAMLTVLPVSVFAQTVNVTGAEAAQEVFNGTNGLQVEGSVVWPWTRFLNSLAQEVTGPLPLVIGIIAVVAAGFGLLFGNGGAGVQKGLTLICVVGVVMFTPTLVQYIYSSATGVTIDMVIGAVSAVTVAPPPLP